MIWQSRSVPLDRAAGRVRGPRQRWKAYRGRRRDGSHGLRGENDSAPRNADRRLEAFQSESHMEEGGL